MAFASSILGAQEAIIKPCDLCEDDDDVNWFCKDCAQYLCERCKKMHLKIASCTNHEIVSILEGVAITKTNICQDHDATFTFFCRTCEKNICSTCLTMEHEKHNFIDHQNLQSEIQIIIQEKEDDQTQMTKSIDELEKYTDQCRETLTKNYDTIDDRLKAINAAAIEEGRKLKESLGTKAEEQLTEVGIQKQILEGRKKEYEETIQMVKQELTLQSTSTLGEFAKFSTSKLQSLKPMSHFLSAGASFIAGKTRQNAIVDMIGKTEGQLKNSPERVEQLHIVNKHNLDVKYECFSISTSADGLMWIGGYGNAFKICSSCSKIIQQIPTGKYESCNRESLACRYIACLPSGDVVVTYGNRDCIDRITSEGKIERLTYLESGCALDIAATGHDEVVIGVSKSMLNPSISSLVICSIKGSELKSLEMDEDLGRFCIDKYGNVITSKAGSSCLTTLDRDGTILKKIKISKPTLKRMACDEYGNILGIPEGYNIKEVYLISDDGESERSYTVECDNRINDICIDGENRLLILVDNKKVIIAKYLESQ